MLFTNGVFTPEEFADRRVTDVLYGATDRAASQVRPSDLLYATIKAGDGAVCSVLTRALVGGAYLQDVLDGIDAYNPGRSAGLDFDGKRERFAPEALEALDLFAAQLSEQGGDGGGGNSGGNGGAAGAARQVGLELLVACVLEHPDARDRRHLGILDAERAARTLRDQVRITLETPASLVEPSGRVRSEEFTDGAWAVLERAGEHAARLGYDRVLPPHCLLALLGETEGPAERLIRLQVPPQTGLAKVAATVADAFRISDRPRSLAPLPLQRDAMGNALTEMLGRARRSATSWGAERIDSPHLLAALLADVPPKLASVLTAPPLGLDLARLRDHLDQALREWGDGAPLEVAFRLPPGLPPAEDLTWLARSEGIGPALHLDHYFEPLSRALFRTTANHVMITGLAGVGTTTLLRELARRAAAGDIPSLRRKRFVRIDCGDVAPDESGAKLAGIIAQVGGRTDLVTCVDGLGSLLRGPGGTDHRLALRSALRERRVHLVGVLSGNDYDELIGSDRALAELTARIEMDEPAQPAARDMTAQSGDGLAAEFGIEVDRRAVEAAVVLSSDYVLNERLPSKAIRVLRRACEDLHYRRTQAGSDQSRLTEADIVPVVAEISGVPAGQISGAGGERIDLERALSESVVGQPDAVRIVAGELRRIRAGLTGVGGRPASVMFFAGLTGVGKTELAKTIARFYSSSKRLQIYPMENFAEPHSISGIIGAPPGYHGHDEGGRLIKDLNSDPYCVFLLDEAEKAHPEVWRPFLNLFDEGWITDQRGTRAFGDRAIFILTSNAGHKTIEDMYRRGRPAGEIADAVRDRLRQERHPRSGQPVFPPEFLARIRQIIVFRPLEKTAMVGISRRLFDQRERFWRERRGKELVVPDGLVTHIALLSHAENVRSGGTEGGRIVEKKIADLVEIPLTEAMAEREAEYERCARIELALAPPGGDRAIPEVRVSFTGQADAP
ncbi:AAA family ATPase [Actinomadura sp. 9N215]|uniref:AAA family ATPase n=1 Tax=Actinomadura sp. 9N215 TaxID=3375150 RepID=UPI0037BC5362